MALTAEDGTGVSGADSYADLAFIRSYSAQRGTTLSSDDDTVEAAALRGMDYLDGIGLGLLSISWPLEDEKLCNSSITSEAALVRLQRAVAQLCVEQHNGVDLTPTQTDAFIIEETVGPITTKFSDKLGGGAGSTPDMPAIDALLGPLVAACGHTAPTGLQFKRV